MNEREAREALQQGWTLEFECNVCGEMYLPGTNGDKRPGFTKHTVTGDGDWCGGDGEFVGMFGGVEWTEEES